jgi:hypothetical protein
MGNNPGSVIPHGTGGGYNKFIHPLTLTPYYNILKPEKRIGKKFVLYNGAAEYPGERRLKLSEAFADMRELGLRGPGGNRPECPDGGYSHGNNPKNHRP